MTKSPLVNNISEVKIVLKNINWDFSPRPSSTTVNPKLFDCRKYHWYPATFIPEIPYTLIELLTKPRARIFDPFLGIGTAYFQALLLNRIPAGADISLFSVKFINLMLCLFDPDVDLMLVLKKIEDRLNEFNINNNYIRMCSKIPHNVHLNTLQCWYTKHNFNTLCFLMLLENRFADVFSKAAVQLSISSILATVSNQDRGWGCIADNVLPKYSQERQIDPIKIFLKALIKLLTDIHKLKTTIDYTQAYKQVMRTESIFHSDMADFDLIKKHSIDFIITSPPYPNMVDYVTSQRLSYYYFGIDMVPDRKNEIGARYLRTRIDSLDNYIFKMKQINTKISAILKNGGLLCYLMPTFNKDNENNKKRKVVIETVLRDLVDLGFEKQIEIDRSIPPLRRSHNLKWATLTSETIHIFAKT